MFDVHRMDNLTGCHPVEIRCANCLSVTGNFDINRGGAGHRDNDRIRAGQIHSRAERARAQNVGAGFVPRYQFRLLIRFVVEKQTKEKDFIIGAGWRHSNAENAFRSGTAFGEFAG